MKYTVHSPVEDHSGEVVGVVFYKGKAVAEDGEQDAALAYFRRRGYKVVPEGESHEEPEPEREPEVEEVASEEVAEEAKVEEPKTAPRKRAASK